MLIRMLLFVRRRSTTFDLGGVDAGLRFGGRLVGSRQFINFAVSAHRWNEQLRMRTGGFAKGTFEPSCERPSASSSPKVG